MSTEQYIIDENVEYISLELCELQEMEVKGMSVFEELKKTLKDMETKGEKPPKHMKVMMAKYSNDWVLQNYPEWIIELGKMPKPFRRK